MGNGTAGNLSCDMNATTTAPAPGRVPPPFVLDNLEVRAAFITIYTVVFCCCFFGNMVVILVVTISRRLRSITNFFLANLAVADLCVGVFCVYQNLFIYLKAKNWMLGTALCKMYMFVQNLSYTASILILMVICLERYVAIIHPIACRQILTPNRLVLVVIGVWCVAAVYSSPRVAWMNVFPLNGTLMCIPDTRIYNTLVYDTVNLLLLYVVPLVVMSLLYTVIASELWHSATELSAAHAPPPYNSTADGAGPRGPPRRASFRACLSRRLRAPYAHAQAGANGTSQLNHAGGGGGGGGGAAVKALPEAFFVPSDRVLRARRGVVRMLIVVVVTFALCNLPFHVRKMWQHGGKAWGFYGDSEFSQVITPLTFLLTYVNSGINPLLYAFMSKNFRKGLREVLCGPLRNTRPGAILTTHTSSILRRSSTRSSRGVSVVTMQS